MNFLRKIISSKFWNEDASIGLGDQQLKTHKYVEAHHGQEFVIDPFDERLNLYTMTSQRAKVKLGDYISIQYASGLKTYKILEIDYYCDGTPDMWIAKLALLSPLGL